MEGNDQCHDTTDKGLLSKLARLGMGGGGKPGGHGYGYGYPPQGYPLQGQGCPHTGYQYSPSPYPAPGGCPPLAYPPVLPYSAGSYPPVATPYHVAPYQSAGPGKPTHNNSGSLLAGGAAGAAAAYGLHRIFHGSHHQQHHGHGHHGMFRH